MLALLFALTFVAFLLVRSCSRRFPWHFPRQPYNVGQHDPDGLFCGPVHCEKRISSVSSVFKHRKRPAGTPDQPQDLNYGAVRCGHAQIVLVRRRRRRHLARLQHGPHHSQHRIPQGGGAGVPLDLRGKPSESPSVYCVLVNILLQRTKVLEQKLRIVLKCYRSKLLPPIKRGAHIDVYILSSGSKLFFSRGCVNGVVPARTWSPPPVWRRRSNTVLLCLHACTFTFLIRGNIVNWVFYIFFLCTYCPVLFTFYVGSNLVQNKTVEYLICFTSILVG